MRTARSAGRILGSYAESVSLSSSYNFLVHRSGAPRSRRPSRTRPRSGARETLTPSSRGTSRTTATRTLTTLAGPYDTRAVPCTYLVAEVSWAFGRYEENHPEWVLYQCDGKTPAWEFGQATPGEVPVDIFNPQVLAWQLQYIDNRCATLGKWCAPQLPSVDGDKCDAWQLCAGWTQSHGTTSA